MKYNSRFKIYCNRNTQILKILANKILLVLTCSSLLFANDWEKSGFIYDAYEWKKRGFTVKKAVQWCSGNSKAKRVYIDDCLDGFTYDEAELWIEYGFTTPEDALKWKKEGFTMKTASYFRAARLSPKLARICPDDFKFYEWENTGLEFYSSYRAYCFGLKPSYFKENEIMKNIDNIINSSKKENIKKADFLIQIVNIFVTAYYNNENPINVYNMIVKAGKRDLDTYEIGDYNPYELVGKTVSLGAELYQLLGKSEGLYRSPQDKSILIHLDFKDKFSINEYVTGIAKGIKPYEYITVLGEEKIIPSFEIIDGYKLSDEHRRIMLFNE